jgi:cytochrome c-type biogenesis protein CcmH/NrfG
LIERPKDRNILSLLGSVYESDNKIELALETYKKEVPADPLNPDSYLDYSRLLMDQARFDVSHLASSNLYNRNNMRTTSWE